MTYICFNWFLDIPAKTATGTIAIQVEDHNDHCPQLTSTAQTACFGENVIYVTAKDKDLYPNAQPFTFDLIQVDSKDKWILEPFNGIFFSLSAFVEWFS